MPRKTKPKKPSLTSFTVPKIEMPVVPKAQPLTPTLGIANTAQRLFDYYNEKLFEPTFGTKLPHVVVMFERTKRTAGVFHESMWKPHDTDDILHGITINTDIVDNNEHALAFLHQTLVHEMCHFWDKLWGKPGKHGYHARSWAKCMRAIGLRPVYLNNSHIKVSDEIMEGGLFEEVYKALPDHLSLKFLSARGHLPAQPVRVENLHGKRFKYECPAGCNVYGKSGLKLMCMDHAEMMEMDE